MTEKDPLVVEIKVRDPQAGETLTQQIETYPPEGANKVDVFRGMTERAADKIVRGLSNIY